MVSIDHSHIILYMASTPDGSAPFAEWLLEALRNSGMTMTDLARKAGVYPSTVSQIVAGEKAIGPDVARKIAAALGARQDRVFRLAGLLTETAGGYQSAVEEIQDIDAALAQIQDPDQQREAARLALAIIRQVGGQRRKNRVGRKSVGSSEAEQSAE